VLRCRPRMDAALFAYSIVYLSLLFSARAIDRLVG